MKKIISTIVAISAVFLVFASLWNIPAVRAGVIALNVFSTNVNNPGLANSTTTVAFLTPGAGTSTLAFNTTTSDQEQIFINFTASSSAAILDWSYQFSNDNVNWFGEDSPIQPNLGVPITNIDHSTTTTVHRWNPGTTATSSKAVLLPNIASKYTRVQFFIPIGGANGAVWAQAVAKSNNPN